VISIWEAGHTRNSNLICFPPLFGGIIAGFSIMTIYSKLTKGNKLVIGAYHLHHSLYSILFIVAALIIGNQSISVLLIGMAVGTIIEHTCSDRFVFVSSFKK
jgi:hypothetical protein